MVLIVDNYNRGLVSTISFQLNQTYNFEKRWTFWFGEGGIKLRTIVGFVRYTISTIPRSYWWEGYGTIIYIDMSWSKSHRYPWADNSLKVLYTLHIFFWNFSKDLESLCPTHAGEIKSINPSLLGRCTHTLKRNTSGPFRSNEWLVKWKHWQIEPKEI